MGTRPQSTDTPLPLPRPGPIRFARQVRQKQSIHPPLRSSDCQPITLATARLETLKHPHRVRLHRLSPTSRGHFPMRVQTIAADRPGASVTIYRPTSLFRLLPPTSLTSR